MMLIALHPTYTLRVEIQDKLPTTSGLTGGQGALVQQFNAGAPTSLRWYQVNGKTGCDEVIDSVRDALSKAGLANVSVSLERFERRS